MAIDKSKCDPELGQKVFQHLKSKGYLGTETGVLDDHDVRIANVKHHVEEMLKAFGLNLQDEQLLETPKRIAKAWVNELVSGLDWTAFPKCTTFDAGHVSNQSFVVEKGAPIKSVCAHHFLPFFGLKGNNDHFDFGPGATIAYIPNGKIIGISKLSRLSLFLSQRPCNQEELCNIIREVLCYVLNTESVAVYMNCHHTCQTLRGSESNGSMVVLSASGEFQNNPAIRSEFLAIARG